MIDAEIDRMADQGLGGIVVRFAVNPGQRHAAEADGGGGQPTQATMLDLPLLAHRLVSLDRLDAAL